MSCSLSPNSSNFNPDPNINFQLNRLLIPGLEQQFAEIGAKIKDFDDWKSQFRGAAPAHEERGDLSQAARLYRAAEFFMSSGDPDRERAADRFIELFYRVHDNQNLQRIEIPYGTGHLYGLRLHSAAQSRGTIVIHAGFDAYVEEFYALAEAIALCGYAVVTFDGHGQSSTLLREKMPMTHEWEKPVGAVLDHLGLADVTLIMLDFFQCVASRRGKLVEVALNVFVRLGLSTPLDMMTRSLMKRDLYSKWGIQQGMHVTGSASPSEYFF